jgi:hypothetical protein
MTRTRTPAAQSTATAAQNAGTDKSLELDTNQGANLTGAAGFDEGAALAREMGVETATDRAAPSGPTIIVHGTRADIDTNETDMGVHDRSIDLNNDFDIYALRDALNAGSQDLGHPMMKGFVETLEFYNELVLIRVSPSAEKDAEKIIEVWNDGTPQRFIRDEWVVAKRKYVEVLARSMPFNVTTPEGVDGMGRMTRRLETHTGQRFPFEMKDRNPRGMNWLNRLFMERT